MIPHWTIRRHGSADDFLASSEAWLLEAEAEHNLLLGLTAQLCEADHGYESPIYLATIESQGCVEGCAFRTPPFKLGLTRSPLDALPALAEDLAAVYDTLPAVFGPPPVAQRFAQLWSERSGTQARLAMRQRLDLRCRHEPAAARRGTALLLPLHGPREPDCERDLPADRL